MKNKEFEYWQVNYISCASNTRWCVVKAPIEMSEYDVKERIPLGGMGDDICEIESLEPYVGENAEIECLFEIEY